jgi:hypothetical protein
VDVVRSECKIPHFRAAGGKSHVADRDNFGMSKDDVARLPKKTLGILK